MGYYLIDAERQLYFNISSLLVHTSVNKQRQAEAEGAKTVKVEAAETSPGAGERALEGAGPHPPVTGAETVADRALPAVTGDNYESFITDPSAKQLLKSLRE